MIVISKKHLKDFLEARTLLQDIFFDVVEEANCNGIEKIIVTSIARTWEEDRNIGGSGVHADGPPWRAIDITTRPWVQEIWDDVAEVVNKRWIYDPSRPHLNVVVVIPHGTGPHAHLQVSSFTKRRI